MRFFRSLRPASSKRFDMKFGGGGLTRKPLLALVLCAISFAATAQNSIATAVVRPSAGKNIAIRIEGTYPVGTYAGYAVHAYGISSLHVTDASDAAAAGVLIPGVPSTIKLFDPATGNYTEVVADGPDVIVPASIVFPDNFIVMNCNDNYFAAGTVGDMGRISTYSSSGTAARYFISTSGSQSPNGYFTGVGPRDVVLGLTYMSPASKEPLYNRMCATKLGGYVGY